MKIAVTGKGGAGKSTVAGILAHLAKRDGKTVLAVDADPDAKLAFALGIPEPERIQIVPIAQREDLIEERTGARRKEYGQIFKLNPHIADVADRFSYPFQGIHLLVLGGIEAGGSGCACPENVFLRHLLSHIILERGEFVIVDMEAGIEHLGRGTAQGVDRMLVVVEPTAQSVATALSIVSLARQIGLRELRFVGNKLASEADRTYLSQRLDGHSFVGWIPYAETIRHADRDGLSLIDRLNEDLLSSFAVVYQNLKE
jgi:CO dehydrogenase maturation factor